MATIYEIAAALLEVTHYNKPAIVEQLNNWTITNQGKNARGVANTPKYVTTPGFNIAGASAITLDLIMASEGPAGLEKVSQLALCHV